MTPKFLRVISKQTEEPGEPLYKELLDGAVSYRNASLAPSNRHHFFKLLQCKKYAALAYENID